ncbi:MAG: septation regulator SpoVG [Firmicutes bacterium]|nr:septation regulator SpoVG [Bacillota bacterium]
MNITDVRVKKVAGEGKMRAVAAIVIDDAFVVRDLRVIEGQNGLFVAMPSRKSSDGEYRDIAHPITAEAREMIQARVLKEYETAE